MHKSIRLYGQGVVECSTVLVDDTALVVRTTIPGSPEGLDVNPRLLGGGVDPANLGSGRNGLAITESRLDGEVYSQK